jgi:hypothetical protein
MSKMAKLIACCGLFSLTLSQSERERDRGDGRHHW